MSARIDYPVNEKENFYFFVKILTSIVLYAGITSFLVIELSHPDQSKVSLYVLMFYAALMIVFLFFRLGLLIGYIKGNAIKVSKDQFPDLYEIVVNQSTQLGLKKVPGMFILQSGGAINAFVARFMGSNYVVVYSEIVEAAYEQDKSLLEFIIGHELGHIKRNHLIKNLLLFPSWLVPFLGAAYSRACEYTCDAIGFALAPNGIRPGLLILASGRNIYKKVNVEAYLHQGKSEGGFWKWFAEKVSTHPHLTKRIAVFEKEPIIREVKPNEPKIKQAETDHSKFMPV